MKCVLCPKACNIDRSRFVGGCKVKDNMIVARAALHFFEEPIISGDKGSGTIFFSGCPLNCVFCQNKIISKDVYGKEITPFQLTKLIKNLEAQGAHNINMVSPTHFTDKIIEALNIYKPSIPIVWNTSGYESIQTIEKLSSYVDIFLTDYKYGIESVGQKYSKVKDYPSVAFNAIKKMIELNPNPVIENGLMKKGLIIRHLVLPSNLENTKACLKDISTLDKNSYILSVMSQFTPCNNLSDYPEINRKLTSLELKYVQSLLDKYELDGYIQELSSASEDYIPDFDLTGLNNI